MRSADPKKSFQGRNQATSNLKSSISYSIIVQTDCGQRLGLKTAGSGLVTPDFHPLLQESSAHD
jgi:hypothetical protein